MALSKSVQQALELDFASDRQKSRRMIVEVLARKEGLSVNGTDMAIEIGISRQEVGNLLSRLIKLTDKCCEIFGFRVIKVSNGNFMLVTDGMPFKERKRPIQRLRGEEYLDVTCKIRKRVSRLIDVPLLELPPFNAEAILINSAYFKEHNYEMDLMIKLLEAAKSGRAINVSYIGASLDIPTNDSRFTHSLTRGTRMRPIELGFVVEEVQNLYRGLFFVEPETREDYLLDKYGELNDFTHLDHAEEFSLFRLRSRLRRINEEDIDRNQSELIDKIAYAQTRNPYTTSQILEETGVSYYAFLALKKMLEQKRREFGFYIKTNGKGRGTTLRCILIAPSSPQQPT